VVAGALTEAEQDLLSASYAEAADQVRTGAWSVADAALLDELVHLLGPVPEVEDRDEPLFLPEDAEYAEVVTTADRLTPPREVDPFDLPHQTYSHVLVDEAQDITPMQWRMLRRRGGGASWTIVGDPAQSSWPDREEYDRALRELVGTSPVRRYRMSTNYRSPAEVFDLAAAVVVQAYPEADLPQAVRSTGVAPRLLVADGRGLDPAVEENVRGLLAEVAGTVGVICPPSLRDHVRDLLAGAELAGSERLAVVTSLESKGLEYDGVLVVRPDRVVEESPGGVRSLYVALTRPTQRLVTLDAADDPASWRRSLG
jgi:superfamily I DNA/RNA helicase